MISLSPALLVTITTIAFGVTYFGMALGRLPGLAADRTGIALIAAIALVLLGALPASEAVGAIDLPTLAILFGLMILSGQFVQAGFYDWCAAKIGAAQRSPAILLALTIAVAGGLSALLTNDVVVYAMTPILAAGLRHRGLDPRPFLVALAAASNAGSAATLIGNPQNILIGQAGGLDFWSFLLACGPAALFSLVIVFIAIRWIWHNELLAHTGSPVAIPAIDRWQTGKGVAALLVLILLFATPVARLASVLGIAALLLVSRRIRTRPLIAGVDWSLILLFACLFLVNAAFGRTGLPAEGLAWLEAHGLLPTRLSLLLPLSLLVSNTISNVPAVVMMLSIWQHPPAGALYALALLTTLAGNLFLVGSLANIIVVERAATAGLRLGFKDFARAGIPITLTSMAAASLWLWAGGWLAW